MRENYIATVLELLTGRGAPRRLADDVGVSSHAVSSWRHGRRRPTPENLLRLAEVLERRSEELAGWAAELRRQAEDRDPHER